MLSCFVAVCNYMLPKRSQDWTGVFVVLFKGVSTRFAYESLKSNTKCPSNLVIDLPKSSFGEHGINVTKKIASDPSGIMLSRFVTVFAMNDTRNGASDPSDCVRRTINKAWCDVIQHDFQDWYNVAVASRVFNE